jgi:hypothetical protein
MVQEVGHAKLREPRREEKVHGDEFAVYVPSPPLSPITK